MEPRARSLPMALVTALWVGLLARIALVWPRLPSLMATHFGAAGRPNGFMSRQRFLLFTLALEAGVVLLLLVAVPWLLHRAPASLINIPNRDYWLAEPRREHAARRMGVWMAWLAVGVSGLLVGVNELVLRANLQRGALDNRLFVPLMVVFGTFLLLWIVGLYVAFRLPRPGG